MKKIKNLLLVLAVLVLLPLNVFAEEKINVYIFKGEGCGYCAKALAFFEGLDSEYKNYFNLVEKEVWNDKDNASEMQAVADHFGEEVSGVPYIIVGNKTFQGFADEYGDEIKKEIKTAYENKDGSYQDVVAAIIGGETISTDKDSNAAVTIIVIIAVIAGIGFLIYMARDDSETQKEVEAEVKKESTVKKTTPKKTSTNKTAPKKTTAKKTTSKKKTTNKK